MQPGGLDRGRHVVICRPIALHANGHRALVCCRHVVICSRDGVGCQGQIALQLKWHHVKQLHPHIAINLNLHPFQIQLHPHHLLLLSKVADCLNESAQQAQHAQQLQKHTAGGIDRGSEGGLVASTRNFIESFALPDCERMAADVLSWGTNREPAAYNLYSSPYQSSFQSAAAYPADLHSMHSMADSNLNSRSSMFHDAQSMMGSMTTTFNSFVSSTAASLGSGQALQTPYMPNRNPPSHQGQAQGHSSGQGGQSPAEEAGSPKDGPVGWEMTASCSEASLVLWYPEGQDEDPDQASVNMPMLSACKIYCFNVEHQGTQTHGLSQSQDSVDAEYL